MSEIKLIAIDIDGTLVNSKKQITPRVKSAIKKAQEQGIKIVIATGRPLSGAVQYLDELGLNKQDDQYVISFNGAVVETTNGKVLRKKEIKYEDYVDLEAISRKLDLHFHTVGLNRIYTAERDLGHYTIYNSRIVKLEVSYRTQIEMKDIPIIKCMYVDEPHYLDEQIKNPLFEMMTDRVTFSKTEPFYYEVTAKDTDKGTGLK